ncbi:DNA translocase FtsK [Nitriliruptoria bacterium AS10]|nr:DNA translocase FtsK [Salsipaludibacter albus]
MGEHVGDRTTDIYGFLLIIVGVVSGLAIYADASGPVGDFFEAIWRGLVGGLAGLVPLGMLVLGVAVVMDRPMEKWARWLLGLTITTTAVLASWNLFAGHPHPSDGIKALWTGGGLVGWLLATPLEAGLSTIGAQAVLIPLAGLGLLVATGTSLGTVVHAVSDFFAELPAVLREEVDEESSAKASKASGASRASTTTTGSSTTTTVKVDEPEPDDAAAERMRATLAQAEAAVGGAAVATDDLTDADREAGKTPSPPDPLPAKQRKAAKVRPVEDWADYQLPPLDLLGSGRSMGAESERTIQAQTQALQATFDQFGIDATVARWSRGPTVTRFEIELGPGVKVNKVANMGDDIAYALAAPDVRIVAPIPGKSAIGVEVPNRERDLITLGDILRSDTADSNAHPLFVALGQDIAGNPAMADLSTMPHLLVAGATGSGKSVLLNAMVSSILMRARPDQVRMILVDPKRVELGVYNGAPHLLSPVVTDPKRATDAVSWCVKEMEMRYETLARTGHRNIDGYNQAIDAGEVEDMVDPTTGEVSLTHERMPYILLVIDELSDLMMVAARDVEDAICRIAQMARAVGIHMVIATQRPSVDVITGLIKANIPSRLALAVASGTDSRTILDAQGAEKLVGKGDMLFAPASQGKASRLQGCFLTEREIEPIVEFCKQQRSVDYVDGVVKEGKEAAKADVSYGADDDSDEALLVKAAEQVVNSGLGSTSMLQRKLRIGFARAGRLMDELEELGVVGPNEGSKAREVLWDPETYDEALAKGLFPDDLG